MAASSPRGFLSVIESLAHGEQPAFSQLTALSDLSRAEAAEFAARWPAVRLKDRLSLVARLAELADDNVDLDFAPVMKVVLDDVEPAARTLAASSLWEATDRGSARKLLSLLMNDSDDGVRAAAAGSLRQFVLLREFDSFEPDLGDEVVDTLRQVAEDRGSDCAVRAAALEALGPRSLPWVDPLIMECYYDDDRELKIAALRAMGGSAQDHWLEYLVGELQSDDPEFRYEAATACGLIASEDAVEPVAERLDDDDAEVAIAAVMALGEIGGPIAAEHLRSFRARAPEALEEVIAEALEMAASGGLGGEKDEEEW